jgi:glycosyltransferase involved in cell wall biosynthesis
LEKNLLPLYQRLLVQTEKYSNIEILCLVDNKKMSIGKKRQSLLEIARGDWLFFIDDDDDISSDFFDQVVNAIKTHPADVITFNQGCSVNGHKFVVNFGMNNPVESYSPNKNYILRPPFHMCLWHKDIVKKSTFKDKSYGEDYDWCAGMYPHVKSETHIDKILHLYNYSDETSESIKHIEDNLK